MSRLSAIGSPASGFAQTSLSKTALRVELARYEKVRSDCVNCASAETIEGKRNIQNLDTRISALKAKLAVVAQPDASATAGEARSSTASAVAGRIDVYA
jgi:hypothetical protein